jgi:hypothetical protein
VRARRVGLEGRGKGDQGEREGRADGRHTATKTDGPASGSFVPRERKGRAAGDLASKGFRFEERRVVPLPMSV